MTARNLRIGAPKTVPPPDRSEPQNLDGQDRPVTECDNCGADLFYNEPHDCPIGGVVTILPFPLA